jgi:hypothetical protein
MNQGMFLEGSIGSSAYKKAQPTDNYPLVGLFCKARANF